MKIYLLLFFLLSLPADWTSVEIEKAKANTRNSKMSSEERDVLFYINLVRINPSKFEKEVLNPFLNENKNYSKKYVKSLRKDLNKINTLSPLNYSDKLYKFAKHHAKTTGAKGKVGHNSVGLRGYKARTKKILKHFVSVGENIHYGFTDPKKVVIELLIDDGIIDVGHRKNILNNHYIFASVSIEPHKKYKYNTVIEFGGATFQ